VKFKIRSRQVFCGIFRFRSFTACYVYILVEFKRARPVNKFAVKFLVVNACQPSRNGVYFYSVKPVFQFVPGIGRWGSETGLFVNYFKTLLSKLAESQF
jgi:hypothetical protein